MGGNGSMSDDMQERAEAQSGQPWTPPGINIRDLAIFHDRVNAPLVDEIRRLEAVLHEAHDEIGRLREELGQWQAAVRKLQEVDLATGNVTRDEALRIAGDPDPNDRS
jgi:hypothetical protein